MSSFHFLSAKSKNIVFMSFLIYRGKNNQERYFIPYDVEEKTWRHFWMICESSYNMRPFLNSPQSDLVYVITLLHIPWAFFFCQSKRGKTCGVLHAWGSCSSCPFAPKRLGKKEDPFHGFILFKAVIIWLSHVNYRIVRYDGRPVSHFGPPILSPVFLLANMAFDELEVPYNEWCVLFYNVLENYQVDISIIIINNINNILVNISNG